MTLLQTALIEKIGRDNGFEYEIASHPQTLTLGSARHRTQVTILFADQPYRVTLATPTPALFTELERDYRREASGEFLTDSDTGLARLLRRAAALAQALPNQAAEDYADQAAKALRAWPGTIRGTEVERMIRQRIGQAVFRQAQLDYWGGACALTGIAVPEVLRASHAKPWAECESDAERLDVFNGFLLTANLDALFDRFLISFDMQGSLRVAPAIPDSQRQSLGLDQPARLRWLTGRHRHYLKYHLERFEIQTGQ